MYCPRYAGIVRGESDGILHMEVWEYESTVYLLDVEARHGLHVGLVVSSGGHASAGGISDSGAELSILKDRSLVEEDDRSSALDTVDGVTVLLSRGLTVRRCDNVVCKVYQRV